MRKLALVVFSLGLLVLPQSSSAWNKPGHKVVAAIAYLSLPAETRARVDSLLPSHPDFARLSEGVPADDPQRGLGAPSARHLDYICSHAYRAAPCRSS